MSFVEAEYDIKLTLGANSRKFRLLRQRDSKAWVVRELPLTPRISQGPESREGLPPDRALTHVQDNFYWGAGLKNPTSITESVGHVFRYADGFGIDTSDPGVVRHGPALLSDVGTLDEAPIQALVWDSRLAFGGSADPKVYFLTPTYLYSWDGTTLTNVYTNPDGAVQTHMATHQGKLYIAGGAKYYYSSAISPTFTALTIAADRFLSVGDQLWRATGNTVTNSTDPDAAIPTWGSTITADDTITNLFSLAGLVGVATRQSLYLVDSERKLVELNKSLRYKASDNAFTLSSESGTDAWFSDRLSLLLRVVANGFESFDIRPGGPFYGYEDRPVDFPALRWGSMEIQGITQDLTSVYVAIVRIDDTTKVYIYKGVEVVRGLFAWTPLAGYTWVTGGTTFLAALKAPGDPLGANGDAILYFTDGAVVKRLPTNWTSYASTWELHTTYITAGLENWDKMAHNLKATLEREANTKVQVYYRADAATSWTAWGGAGNEMDDDGANEIALSTPVSYKRIQFRFVGSTTNATKKVNLNSIHFEALLRPELKRVFDFTVIADSKGDADFIYSLRESLTAFITLVDRFGTSRTVYILPGYPIEYELVDELRKAPVRVYQIQAIEV